MVVLFSGSDFWVFSHIQDATGSHILSHDLFTLKGMEAIKEVLHLRRI